MGSHDASNGAGARFDIKIIGGGIAGLASGIALARKGHRCTVYESTPSLSDIGAGIQLFANATRILRAWGLEEECLKTFTTPKILQFVRFENDSVFSETPQNPQSTWMYGSPLWQVYRPDIQKVLVNAAAKEGVKTIFGAKVVDVEIDQGRFTLADGRVEEADLVIAADGIRSKLRQLLPGNEGIEAVSAGEHCYRTTIPKEKMDLDPETAELMQSGTNKIWCGPDRVVLAYPVHAMKIWNLLLSCPRPSDAPVGKWSEPGDVKEAQQLAEIFSPAVRKMWSYVDSCSKWTLAEVPPVARYVSASGRFAIIGDGAHGIVPHSGQGGAMALEDAAALGEFVSTARDVADLARVMAGWETFRMTRMDHLRRMAHGNQNFMTLPDGPEQERRDKHFLAMTAAWKKELEELGEEGIRAKPKAKPVPGESIFATPESRMYVHGYDIFAESQKFLQSEMAG